MRISFEGKVVKKERNRDEKEYTVLGFHSPRFPSLDDGNQIEIPGDFPFDSKVEIIVEVSRPELVLESDSTSVNSTKHSN